jgi:hypothetical protein
MSDYKVFVYMYTFEFGCVKLWLKRSRLTWVAWYIRFIFAKVYDLARARNQLKVWCIGLLVWCGVVLGVYSVITSIVNEGSI